MAKERDSSRAPSSQNMSSQSPERQPLANISTKTQSPSSKPKSSGDDDDDVTAFFKQPASQPEFGKASPLRNPLKKREPSVFIPRSRPVPKSAPSTRFLSSAAQQAQPGGTLDLPAPESRVFYLPGQAPNSRSAPGTGHSQPSSQQNGGRGGPYASQAYNPVPWPANAPSTSIQAPPKPVFSSTGFTAYNQVYPQSYQTPKDFVDLTKQSDAENEFDPDAEIRREGLSFGAPDPYSYVDASQANENIKNLLEGSFDDDTDKSRTKLRNRAKKAAQDGRNNEAKNLADKLASLKVEDDKKAAEAAKLEEAQEAEDDEDEEDEEDGTVEGLAVKLLPHQVEGVAWMIDKETGQNKRSGVAPKGGILADDMGLGKTIQSVALMLTNARPALGAKPEYPKQILPGKEVSKSTLVVAPLALIKQWEDEIKTKVARGYGLKVLVHHGSSRTKSSAELKKYDVVITTYQTLTSEHAGSNMKVQGGNRIGCMGVHWYRIILDEAHSIKNRNAKSTQACYALDSWYRWCLTGTPMQNNLDELQSLIKFLQIKPYCEHKNWKETIIQPMKNGRGGLAMKRLQIFLRAVMKRRTKDILKKEGALNFGGKPKEGEAPTDKKGGMQIVKREVVSVQCDFDAQEKGFYTRLQNRADQHLKEMQSSGNDYMGALVLLLRLRQACDHYHLIGLAVNKDKDAMTIGANANGPKSRAGDNGMDELTALMGGVTVAAKTCDVCQAQLSASEAQEGAVRCHECTADLAMMVKSKKKSKSSKKGKVAALPRRKAHQLPADSDDEGEGEWIAKGPEQHIDLGKAGGTDDEDAEGGGETLESIDSDRSDSDSDQDDSPPRAQRQQRPTVKAEQADVESEQASGSENDAPDFDISRVMWANHRKSPPTLHTPSTKIRYLLRILHAETPEHKTIVFSQFTSMLDLIEPHLDAAGISYVRYDGSMRNDAREAALDSLRNNSETRVLLCSLKCGSLGLNLTAASRVVIVEPFWNPFVEEQAIDRVHRLNQTVDVKVFRLMIRDTVEERIIELQQRKRELAEAAIEGAGNKIGKLSMQEILGLFKHDGGGAGAHDKEDREMWEKFGGDSRLLDGSSWSDAVMSSSRTNASFPGKARYQEHDVFGRRW